MRDDTLPRDLDLLALHEHSPQRYPILLESVSGADALGRHDVLFALPGARLIAQPDGTLSGDAPIEPGSATFLDALDRWFTQALTQCHASAGTAMPAVSVDTLPATYSLVDAASRAQPRSDELFAGGWFLYLGYELAEEIEPSLRLPRSRLPRAVAWRMQGAILRDRRAGGLRVLAESPALASALARQVDDDLRALSFTSGRANSASVQHAPQATGATYSAHPGGRVHSHLAVSVSEEAPQVFQQGVRDVLESIAAGNVYQANLSRAWTARLGEGYDTVGLYRALRRANPAPFAAIAQLGDFAVLSSSPERLLEVRKGLASTRPIAGTRPRGRDAAADADLVHELRLNEKERAEHVMLVDLERNDLGRICRGGTVEVDEFMTIETYATVHHIVSNVRGRLRDDVTPGQAIAAVFPGGTITGCPKVRCMQILADLEQTPREAYTGSLGYLGVNGALDLNILIRTLTLAHGEIGFRTGAGIVADSIPEFELAETRAKAHGILRALGDPA